MVERKREARARRLRKEIDLPKRRESTNWKLEVMSRKIANAQSQDGVHVDGLHRDIV